MTLPVFEAGRLSDAAPSVQLATELRAACFEWGAFWLHPSPLADLQAEVLAAASAFFELPHEQKQALGINRSPHFRGYSQLTSTADDRQQIHFGPEATASRACVNGYVRLRGPNLWPETLGEAWRATVLAYLQAASELGRNILLQLGRAFELSSERIARLFSPHAYTLLKLMRYVAPLSPGTPEPGREPQRCGMAAHCDWSLITLLLQTGDGLQIRTPTGTWLAEPNRVGGLLVTLGELLQVVSGGLVQATPHRVLGMTRGTRTSVPVFINPDLDQLVAPLRPPTTQSNVQPHEHVHRVLRPGVQPSPFCFGDSEWTRKGCGQWCHRTECLAVS